MTKNELNTVLQEHQQWLNDGGGERANLWHANLQGANLRDAYLRDANLWHANLRDANLQGANLRDVDLRYTDLRGADLCGADLCGADLCGAYLRGADLRGADLRSANLWHADLRDANLQGASLPHYQIPQHVELRVYKKVEGRIVHLKIPKGARRTASLVGRKCRAERAVVLAIQGDNPVESRGVVYSIGDTVYPDSYDDDPRVECTHGIHFFVTRQEAEEY